MENDNRQEAYNYLVDLASKQGYVTFDEIMDCAEKYVLPIQDFDWLSSSIIARGILVYDEAPSRVSDMEDDEYEDFSQSDYEEVYRRIIELSPSLEPFVNSIREIIPPQRNEVRQLKYQVVDGNKYARSRMIEMYLRHALKAGLQRAEAYDMAIEDAIGYACIGLVTAVDKYDPDTSGPFATYANLWMLQTTSREQSTSRPLIYYPVHQKENYLMMYPILKKRGCIDCSKLSKCDKVRQMVIDGLECSVKEAEITIEQMIPDRSIDDLINLYSNKYCDIEYRDVMIDAALNEEASNIIVSDEDIMQEVHDKLLHELVSDVLKTMTLRENKILELRFGLNDGRCRTLEEVGQHFGLTRERIRQIEAKALRKLRHPARSKRLKGYQ